MDKANDEDKRDPRREPDAGTVQDYELIHEDSEQRADTALSLDRSRSRGRLPALNTLTE